MAKIAKRLPIVSVGVGRRDYSMNAEMFTAPITRSYQDQAAWYAYFPLLPCPLPFWYLVSLDFLDETGAIVPYAPTPDYYIYSGEITSDRNSLVVIALAVGTDLAIEEILGLVFGYNSAKIEMSKGIRTVKGKYYYVFFADYSGLPTDVRLSLTGINATTIW